MLNATTAMDQSYLSQTPDQLWKNLAKLSEIDESEWLNELLSLAEHHYDAEATQTFAKELVGHIKSNKKSMSMLDALLLEYSLSTHEGVLLMSLSEALIRIPDQYTAQALIEDKLALGNWMAHRGKSNSVLVNTATWSLLLTGQLLNLSPAQSDSGIRNMLHRFSAPTIRTMIRRAMKIIGYQFVLGEDIHDALKNGGSYRKRGYTYTFDMLGEAALTQADAQAYKADYLRSIETVGTTLALPNSPKPSISIKLSALHPRYDSLLEQRVLDELVTTVLDLVREARARDVAITIDAEEADRLEISLKVFAKVYRHEICRGWGKMGLVVQAYSKRALAVLSWLASLAHEVGDEIPTRLVKGAYWDSEIKLYQQRGLKNYPVFTRKEGTDVSYLACARMMLSEATIGLIAPQFASHNAQTISAIMKMPAAHPFEFQRLHGMGDVLYDRVIHDHHISVRIYAPVGKHADLLPYLVRRLLENGANNSFVHRLVDPKCSIGEIIEDPIHKLRIQNQLHNPRIPLPSKIYGDRRPNSQGFNLHSGHQLQAFLSERDKFAKHQWRAGSLVEGQLLFDQHTAKTIHSPFDRANEVGLVSQTTPLQLQQAFAAAEQAYPSWDKLNIKERANCLRKTAELMEQNFAEFIALCQFEAGKTIQDSIDEIREAVDFCYYYANQAEVRLGEVRSFEDYAGQSCSSAYQGRGIFACISPWNFPMAIFTGQIVAALVTGNAVIAKAAPQTSLIATRTIELMHQAGVPVAIVQLVTGGADIGQQLTSDPRIAGVAFTGSTATAQAIHRSLAEREQLPVPLIAETGGQNAMIVDSSALPEQVIKDVLRSAFASAGQRCSALRVLCIQEDVADIIIKQLAGAMKELNIGNPLDVTTDIGPVIDEVAVNKLQTYQQQLRSHGKVIFECPLSQSRGLFVAPSAYEIESFSELKDEQFGPILHVIRYPAKGLETLITQINQLGFGLTLGIHSRIEHRFCHIARQAQVGNCYINRDQVGASVGSQPFGGRGLSGTGPKAGGPHYLYRFSQRITVPVTTQGEQ
ncbi:bifunctional proline dehydrogenase/L-glutamate gamma-semialdehyde dehydrogenase PutA [Celerinatantimonas yamalensis]|uniref:Bifunctional protein PutA n=1 Tax=Celerinatantimonas yamalensis TaxID=559956 RepID=A0ABW9G2I0_9GAMM